ncbi:DUF5691 domain-containing protein [Nocardioides sp. BP30]|uniref:DUF5691 domain-containing protein n=1 Tax=Nocardioides sp. BP30 TaxID=3036374 RepID=UPI0024687B6C|nr:DUF5691 domain-containing protein [Nocardioides sp. BP30]WGL52269.1 DUF5691 domain-containing protein [Nocardioides sp. BP30]
MTGPTQRWWADLLAAALLGTARRPPPSLPAELGVHERADAVAEERLLDAAAVGAMLVRAGADGVVGVRPAPAPDDDAPAAADRAVQLLHLLLDQPPFPVELATTALLRWLRLAADRGRRIPHAELPRLLDAATRHPALREPVAAVAGARGRWLAAANPAWSWLGPALAPPPDGDVTPAGWARATITERIAVLVRTRRADPAAGRALVESTWATDPARDRPQLLRLLEVGIGLEDEGLLERALDDRAAAVRDVAQRLLDRLPGSARAARMSARLRPLVRTRGILRHGLGIDLPDQPDAAAVRDGLGKRPGDRSSERGYWLEQLAAAVPLDFWTEITGRDPAATWRLVHAASPDAARGVVRAASVRHDPDWLAALVRAGAGPGLLALLPPEVCAEIAPAHLAGIPPHLLPEVLANTPPTWSGTLSTAVLGRIAAEKAPAGLLNGLLPLLAERLPGDAVATLQRLARAEGAPRGYADLVQYLSFVPAIPEAFG